MWSALFPGQGSQHPGMGKFLYEESKRQKESNTRSSANKMKEVQLTPTIDKHDFAVKLSHAIGFLCDDMKVRIKLRFRGRQKAHKEFGFEIVNKFVKEAAAYGQADSPPKMLGDRDLNVMLSPLPRNKRGKDPRPRRVAEAPEVAAGSDRPKAEPSVVTQEAVSEPNQ